jgi:flagellar hook assembly protein FlgD
VNWIESLLVLRGSTLHFFSSTYTENTDGIIVIGATANFAGSHLLNNHSRSLFIKDSPGFNSFNNSTIVGGGRHGIHIVNSVLQTSNSTISGNTQSGIFNVALKPPALGTLTLQNNISGNNHTEFAEMHSSGIGFPISGIRTISNNRGNQFKLLRATSPMPNGLIDVRALPITGADTLRVVPANAFRFRSNIVIPCTCTSIMVSVMAERIANCITSFDCPGHIIEDIKDLVMTFPNSPEAAMFIGFLPYLWQEYGRCSITLTLFLDNIDHPNLDEIAQFYLATHFLLNNYYECSLYLFEDLSQTAVNQLVVLFSEMGQARSYHRLVTLGLRTDHEVTHKPTSDEELAYIMGNLMERLEKLNNNENITDECDFYDTLPEITITALHPNHPNPFNPYTTIRFSVGAGLASAHVSLDIFNIRGQRVRTLVSGYKQPGHHSVVWNGRDNDGRAVGSGVYFYRLQAGEFTETRRMLLLK